VSAANLPAPRVGFGADFCRGPLKGQLPIRDKFPITPFIVRYADVRCCAGAPVECHWPNRSLSATEAGRPGYATARWAVVKLRSLTLGLHGILDHDREDDTGQRGRRTEPSRQDPLQLCCTHHCRWNIRVVERDDARLRADSAADRRASNTLLEIAARHRDRSGVERVVEEDASDGWSRRRYGRHSLPSRILLCRPGRDIYHPVSREALFQRYRQRHLPEVPI